MRILLDTHTFLWFVLGSAKLSKKARTLIEDPEKQRLLSVGSLWEMAIKIRLGKLTLHEPFEVFVPQQLKLNGIGIFPIELDHVATVAKLPLHHRDPFDRLVIAQALVESIPVISIDLAWDAYGVDRRW